MLKDLWLKLPITTQKHIKSALVLLGGYTLFALLEQVVPLLNGQKVEVKEVAVLICTYLVNILKVQMSAALADAANGINQ